MLERKFNISHSDIHFEEYIHHLQNDLAISDFHPLFYDIETTGLSPKDSYLYMIGMIYQVNDTWILHQIMTESIEEEPALLRLFHDIANHRNYHFIQYNGNYFDQPFLSFKYDKFQIESPFTTHDSTDLCMHYKQLKPAFGLRSMKLVAIEKLLRIPKRIYPDGKDCISYYQRLNALNGLKERYGIQHKEDYEQIKMVLFGHNQEDLLGLLRICSLSIYYTLGLDMDIFRYEEAFVDENWYTIQVGSQIAYPVSVLFDRNPDYQVHIYDHTLTIKIKIHDGKMKLYHTCPSSYVYLYEEDHIIPKSLAEFMDSSLYTKATMQNCYTWFELQNEFENDISKQMQIVKYTLLHLSESI